MVYALLFPLGNMELLLILVIVMIIFGVGKLPKVLGQMGRGVREFRAAAAGEDGDDEPNTISADETATR